MKIQLNSKTKKGFLLFFFILTTNICSAQEVVDQEPKKKSTFWKNVRFGGGLGLGFGDGFTSFGVSPSAIYVFNDRFASGVGLSAQHTTNSGDFKATILGGSLIGLFKPIEEIVLSTEFEANHVYFKDEILNSNREYWYPALFVGAGYNIRGFGAVGLRYDLLYNEEDSIYGTALLPFVRFYF